MVNIYISKRKRIFSLLLLIVFIISVFAYISFGLGADDDGSTGSFGLLSTSANDPSVILGWFYTDDLIQPYISVEFNVTVYDVDNTSDELIVKLYYSDTVFYLTNNSVNMIFAVENSFHNYTYTYVITGQRTNTKIHYYYTIDDGETLQRIPTSSDEFYDVLWSAPAVTIIRNVGEDDIIQYLIDISPIAVLAMVLAIMILILSSKKQKKVK